MLPHRATVQLQIAIVRTLLAELEGMPGPVVPCLCEQLSDELFRLAEDVRALAPNTNPEEAQGITVRPSAYAKRRVA
ncbi:hypothetical protein BH09MYX1_BH09MYX1_35890 [soil metagenome]